MITYDKPIADVYVLPARSIMMPTTPGRTVRFMGGHAVVRIDTDLMALMRRSDVKIQLTPYALSWYEGWMAQVGERLQAELYVPEPEPPAAPVEETPDPTMTPQMSWDPAVRLEMQGGANSAEPDPGVS
jgi:hypothetical protein